MPDAALGHDRDGDGLFNAYDQFGITHARHAPMSANVSGDALQGHYSAGSGLFSDPGLFRVDNIADYSTLEHLWKRAFDVYGTCLFFHVCSLLVRCVSFSSPILA